MSFLNQSGDLKSVEDLIPGGLALQQMKRSTPLLTARRSVRIPPQQAPSFGTGGVGGGGAQLSFLVSDMGGFVDLRTMRISYYQQTSRSDTIPDDGHPFVTCQIQVAGNPVDNITDAHRVTNAEVALAGSKSWYQSAGSYQGFELLNQELIHTSAVLAGAYPSTLAGGSDAYGGWGQVACTAPSIGVRYSRTNNLASSNGIAGAQRSIPLGLISGFGRCPVWYPVNLLGEILITLTTGAASQVLFATGGTTTGDYSLANLQLSYDIVVPDVSLMKMLADTKMPIVIPFESTTCSQSVTITQSATLKETILQTSRGTSNLLRSHVFQQPSSLQNSIQWPTASCFSQAGTFAIQWRLGSLFFPTAPAQGAAELWTTSMCAYGSPVQEQAGIVNRILYGHSTNITAAGDLTQLPFTDSVATGTAKFNMSDRAVYAYGFQNQKGNADQTLLDGINVSASNASRILVALTSAPSTNYSTWVTAVATKVLQGMPGSGTVVIGG